MTQRNEDWFQKGLIQTFYDVKRFPRHASSIFDHHIIIILALLSLVLVFVIDQHQNNLIP